VNGRPLLEHVISGARDAGIERVVVVIGYRGHAIKEWYASQPVAGVQVIWIENPDYHKANGISVLSAKKVIDENFLLLMADHIFQPETAKALLRQRLGRNEVILAVDRNVPRIFDLDDATKVRLEQNSIVEIGKCLETYNALDTGMFHCTPALFNWLESAAANGNCSLSDGLRLMARRGKFKGFDIGDSRWQDVDTPEALDHVHEVFPLIRKPGGAQGSAYV
jgi:choline kinase